MHLIKIQVLIIQQLSHFKQLLAHYTPVYKLTAIFRSQYYFYLYLKPVRIIEY